MHFNLIVPIFPPKALTLLKQNYTHYQSLKNNIKKQDTIYYMHV